jgi:hypothetical protein
MAGPQGVAEGAWAGAHASSQMVNGSCGLGVWGEVLWAPEAQLGVLEKRATF